MKPNNIQKLPVRQRISEIDFCAWLGQAEPGDTLEYYRGFLGVDLTPFGNPMSLKTRAELARIRARVYDLAERSFVHLVQRRLGADTFSYLAIARPTSDHAPVSFKALMFKEAA